jgi:hypothetical protein
MDKKKKVGEKMSGEHGQKKGAHTTLAYCTTHFLACAAVAESEKLHFFLNSNS